MKWILPCQGFVSDLQLSKACHSGFRLPIPDHKSFIRSHRDTRSSLKFVKERSRVVRVKASFYTVLQVDKLASKEEIRKAYRRLARRYHPDVDGTPEAQKRLQVLIPAC